METQARGTDGFEAESSFNPKHVGKDALRIERNLESLESRGKRIGERDGCAACKSRGASWRRNLEIGTDEYVGGEAEKPWREGDSEAARQVRLHREIETDNGLLAGR